MTHGDAASIPPVGSVVGPVVEVHHPDLARLIDPSARLARLVDGCIWAEGAAWLPREAAVQFSDIPNDRAMRWSASRGGHVWLQPNDFTNGNTLDHEGRVLHCEHGNRRIARTELDGVRHGLVDRHAGLRLNSPNDIVVRSDGTIWFTDPPYGILSDREGHAAPQEQAACYVFRYDEASGDLTALTDALVHPNGLAFSPDESVLYVSDTSGAIDPAGNHHILAFDVEEGRRLGPPRVFAVIEDGFADGFRVDQLGNVWTSAEDGIHILDPGGTELGRIRVPEKTANCVFGGADGRRLFIVASSSLYAIDVLVVGAGVAAAVARGESPARTGPG